MHQHILQLIQQVIGVRIITKLWSPGPVEHQGEFYSFGRLRCEPLPVQRPPSADWGWAA